MIQKLKNNKYNTSALQEIEKREALQNRTNEPLIGESASTILEENVEDYWKKLKGSIQQAPEEVLEYINPKNYG